MKLAVVGGGSTYTPELIDGFARLRDTLPLHRAGAGRPGPPAGRADRRPGAAHLRAAGPPGHGHHDHQPGGRRRGRRRGAAPAAGRRPGRARRRRVVPAGVLLRRAGDDRRRRLGQGPADRAGRAGHRRADADHAPDAWIIDFTNPVGIVTRALLQAGHRAMACATWPSASSALRGPPGRGPAGRSLDHVGLNHLTWERGVYVGGRDVLPEALAESTLAELSPTTSTCPPS